MTGLSFAKAFKDKVKVLESNSVLGGNALSYKIKTNVGTFGFDIGGHWFQHKDVPDP